jgi:hypothetical protein
MKFRVHTLGDTFVVFWAEGGLGRKVSARRNQGGATYAREVSAGDWRYAELRSTGQILFTDIRQLSSLVLKMMRDDTFPKV